MLDTLHASPSAGSYCQEPMSASEIDAHADCDRIWATIAAMREEAEKDLEEERERSNAKEKAARSEQRQEDIAAMEVWGERMWRDFMEEYADHANLHGVRWLKEQIANAGDEL